MSETKNLKLKKHDNPETNTNEFDIENYLNGNWDKIDETVGENKEYIEQLKLENEKLREDIKGLPQGEFSGESIDLNDSTEMRLQEFKIEGNSRQEVEPTSQLPIEVECCGDNIQILKGVDNATELTATGTWENGTWRSASNGTGTRTSIEVADMPNVNIKLGWRLTESNGNVDIAQDNVPVINGETYTMSCYARGTGLLRLQYGKSPYVSRGYQLSNTFCWKKYILTFTVGSTSDGSTAGYTNIYFGNGGAGTIEICGLKLEKGSMASENSKYGQGNINIKICNQNYIDVFSNFSKGYSETIDGITYTLNEDGTIIVNGTNTTNSWTYFLVVSDSTAGYDKDSFVDGNKYFLTGAPTGSSSSTYRLQFYDSANSASVFDYGNGTKVQRTIKNKGWNVAIGIAKGVTVNNLVFKPILLKGDYSGITIPDYKPYQSQTYTIPTQKPFRKIDTYKDTFIRKNNKRYEKHYIARKILDGTEEYNLMSSNAETGIFQYRTANGFISNLKTNPDPFALPNIAFCNYFNKITNLNANIQEGFTISGLKAIGFNTKFTSIDNFKSWLSERYNAGTPVYIDYVLETPEDIECTAEQTEILDKIENEAKTYKGITHIYSTDNVSPNMEGRYFKDIETMIRNGVA